MPLVSNGIVIDITANNQATPVIQQVTRDVQGMEAQTNNLGTASNTAAIGLDSSAMAMSMLAIAASVATIAVSAFVKAFEFGEIAAGNERLMNSGEMLAESYGTSLDTIVEKVKEASLGTVSEMDIIASSNKAMMLGVSGDADELAKLMEIAAFKGRAMGLTTQQAFDDMARGIGRLSPMILDNLGIIVDAKTTYANYAESIGKTSTELTRAEKIHSLTQRVIEEGNKQLEAAGGLSDDAAASYERLSASTEDLKNDFFGLFGGMSEINQSLTDVVKMANAGVEALGSLGDVVDKADYIMRSYAPGADRAAAMTKYLADMAAEIISSNLPSFMQATSTEVDSATSSYTAMALAYSGLSVEVEGMASSYAALEISQEEQLSLIGKMQSEEEKYLNRSETLSDQRIEIERKKSAYLTEFGNSNTAKLAEFDIALAKNNQEAKKNADEHELAGRRIVLNMLEQQLAADGLTEAEVDFLLRKGREWGIYSDSVIFEANMAMAEVKKLGASIEDIPPKKSIMLEILESFKSTIGLGLPPGKASGGSVSGNLPYIVGEQGPELFVPSSSGNIIPNNKMGGSITVNFTYAPAFGTADAAQIEQLVPVVTKIVRNAYVGGQLGG